MDKLQIIRRALKFLYGDSWEKTDLSYKSIWNYFDRHGLEDAIHVYLTKDNRLKTVGYDKDGNVTPTGIIELTDELQDLILKHVKVRYTCREYDRIRDAEITKNGFDQLILKQIQPVEVRFGG